MNGKVLIIAFLGIFLISNVALANDLENYLQIRGEATTIVTPDIAHCFLIITGDGESYESANKSANDKLSQLTEVLKAIFQETPHISLLKVENKPKAKTFDQSYQKEFFVEMAKAIKGEVPADAGPAKKEMVTNISIYFSLNKFPRESILKLMSSLAEKEIAFDKGSPFDFDFPSEFTFNKSAVYYGIANTDTYLETLAAEAFRKAEHDAKIIAASCNKRLAGLVNVTGCGEILEGNASLSFKTNLTGKDLGPLSTDPSRLIIRFSKDFGFRIE